MPQQPVRGIDDTSLALGEMREFMSHTRRQGDETQATLREHDKMLQQLHKDQSLILQTQSTTSEDVGEIKVNLQKLCDAHTAKKISRKAKLKGAGIGALIASILGAVYYGDTEMLQIVYRHTIGLLV